MKEVQLQWSLPHPFPKKLTASTLTRIDIIIWNSLNTTYLILVSFPILFVAWAFVQILHICSIQLDGQSVYFPYPPRTCFDCNFKPTFQMIQCYVTPASFSEDSFPSVFLEFLSCILAISILISFHRKIWSSVRHEWRLSVRCTPDEESNKRLFDFARCISSEVWEVPFIHCTIKTNSMFSDLVHANTY